MKKSYEAAAASAALVTCLGLTAACGGHTGIKRPVLDLLPATLPEAFVPYDPSHCAKVKTGVLRVGEGQAVVGPNNLDAYYILNDGRTAKSLNTTEVEHGVRQAAPAEGHKIYEYGIAGLVFANGASVYLQVDPSPVPAEANAIKVAGWLCSPGAPVVTAPTNWPH